MSVLFAKLYSSQGKRLQKNSLNEEQTFYFYLLSRHFIFFAPVGKQTIFFKKIPAPPPPPEYQMVRLSALINQYYIIPILYNPVIVSIN